MNQKINSIGSRINQYPHPHKQIPREIHAPCRWFSRNSSSSRSNNDNNSRVFENEGSIDNVEEELFFRVKRAGKSAVETLRYFKKKEEEVVYIDKEDDVDEVEFLANGHENGKMGSVVDDVGRVLGRLSLDFDNYDLLVLTDNNRLARFQFDHHVKKQDEKGVSEDLFRKAFLPLTCEEKDEVYQALLLRNRKKILVTHESSNIEISGEALQCLKLGQWLNDEVINVYLELLKEREKREPKRFPKCHFFNTFFYKKLIGGKSGYDYTSVRRWTTQKKLGYTLSECDKVFVPIHKQAHWCLAVINKKDKKFQYLDSLGGIDAKVLRVLAMYFVDEVKDKCEVDIDMDSWTQEHVTDNPLQKNGWDCGMFMIKYIDFYSSGLGLRFNQEHMPYFRLRTIKEILRLEAI